MQTRFFQHVFTPGWWHSPYHALGAAWFVWAISWFIAAVWSRQTAQRANFADEAPYRIVTALGALMMFGIFEIPLPGHWHVTDAFVWVMVACAVAGFAFAWWARVYLGTLWSGTITRKEDHRIVDTGPYALVRHPIYTGLIFAALATSLAIGASQAVLGALLIGVGCWMKARVEERFLAEGLGEEAYAGYRARVPMLVPFTGGL